RFGKMLAHVLAILGLFLVAAWLFRGAQAQLDQVVDAVAIRFQKFLTEPRHLGALLLTGVSGVGPLFLVFPAQRAAPQSDRSGNGGPDEGTRCPDNCTSHTRVHR